MYVTIFEACLDEEHDRCAHYDHLTSAARAARMVGGGACICECHWPTDQPINQVWIDSVREEAHIIRDKRGQHAHDIRQIRPGKDS